MVFDPCTTIRRLRREKKKNPEVNALILKERVDALNEVEGPRIGDYLRLPDGSFERITLNHAESFQTGALGQGSFFLYKGSCLYSGAHKGPIPFSAIRETRQTKLGNIWFFNEGEAKEGNGVDFEIEFRVFEIKKEFYDTYRL